MAGPAYAALLVVAGMVLAPATARAQSCGDLDGNGVDVIDASNVARAAVGLPSACTSAPERCDLDGDGQITVLDAASAARRAVGLPGADACPSEGPIGGPTSPQGEAAAALLLQLDAGLFDFAYREIGRLAAVQAAGGTVVPCEQGFAERFDDATEFNQCQLDAAVLDGRLTRADDAIELEFMFDLLDSEDFFDLRGTLELVDGVLLDGVLDVFSTSAGSFDLAFLDACVAVSPAGAPTCGSLTLDVDLDGTASVEATFDGADPILVVVTFDDGSTETFELELGGTPTSAARGAAPVVWPPLARG